ncbi:MAG: methylenetetrahydrofolate dehydrogenase (NADP+)/methenyltetrahydrofolate cyclohydrolase [Candidatus Paceibacteria bacterium]|jgi:methylenetetrahydrofolate dehydrogenase (NADP+)/methenyltetrahydrofolate cyclohydrolase
MGILVLIMPTIVDGKKIAEEIKKSLYEYTNSLEVPISFHIIYVGSDPIIDNFIKYKQRFGESLGVDVIIHNFPADILEEELVNKMNTIEKIADSMIVQLPLPGNLDVKTILSTVPSHKDVDVLGDNAVSSFREGNEDLFPPVTGSIVEVLDFHKVVLKDKKIVIIGNGSLVGYPTTLWLDNNNFSYSSLVKESPKSLRDQLIKNADIIIAGAGSPGLIKAHMVKKGVVLIDAGTSEAGKKIVGDIAEASYAVSSLYTPVPGGIGPITIAVLYRNIIHSHKQQHGISH